MNRVVFLWVALTFSSVFVEGFFFSPGYLDDSISPEDEAWQIMTSRQNELIAAFVQSFETLEVEESSNLAVNDTSPECERCTRLSGAVLLLVQQGYTYDDIKPQAYNICMSVCDSAGWDGFQLCDGILDNYAPQVLRAFNMTTLTAEEICSTVNNCQPDTIPPLPLIQEKGNLKRKGFPEHKRLNSSLENAIKVVHITDIHIEAEYDIGSATSCNMPMCCRNEWIGTGYAGEWGSYGCNLPLTTTEQYLSFLAGVGPAMILYTGDTPASTPWLESQEGQLDQSRWMADRFATHFPGIPAYSTIGNHEIYPTNLYHMSRPEIVELNVELGAMWQTMSGLQQEQLDTMALGGYYSVLVWPGLRVLSYNSNFLVSQNVYVIVDQENNGYGAMKQFMADALEDARISGEKVIMLGHHASGREDLVRDHGDFMTNLTKVYSDEIVLHLVGHSHRDRFKVNTDPDTGAAYDYQMSVASMAAGPHMNPSARIIYLDPDTLAVLDMDTYYLNLSDPINNSTSGPVVTFGFRFTEEYNTTDCSPESMADLVERMKTDDTLVAKYRHNYESRTGIEGPCDVNCKAQLICDVSSTSYTQYQHCLADAGLPTK